MMSDLHGHLPKWEDVPECDIVGLCGDNVPLDYQNDDVASIAWFCLEFVPWTDKLRCKKVLFIAGNHDFFLEHLMYGSIKDDGTRKMYSASDVLKRLLPGNNKGQHKLVYLRDSSFKFEGKTFYGTPWITDLPGWAFNCSENYFKENILSKIPNRCDVLMLHMPPSMCNMGTVLQSNYNYGTNYGNESLTDVLMKKQIAYTFCGHVHSGEHEVQEYKKGCKIVNVSIKDERYCLWNKEIIVYEI